MGREPQHIGRDLKRPRDISPPPFARGAAGKVYRRGISSADLYDYVTGWNEPHGPSGLSNSLQPANNRLQPGSESRDVRRHSKRAQG